MAGETKSFNHGYFINSKMMMEGIEVPFRSAIISSTPNGVEMNIDVHPTDKIFDLKPKTSIEIWYRDWYGANPQWRLLGKGAFSAFGKYEAAQGNRGVTLMCRDFRMDIRKTPSSMIYLGGDGSAMPEGTAHKFMTIHGLKNNSAENLDLYKQAFGDSSGLKGFETAIGFVTKYATGKTTQLASTSADGRYILDVFARGVWMQSKAMAPYAALTHARTRPDKNMVIPPNQAGFNFLSEQYMSTIVGQIVYGQSMFSSVEAVIMRVGAILQTFPYACSTPSLIDINTHDNYAMSSSISRKIATEEYAKGTFGDPCVLNSCMLLPPLNFTAPPNCNILFPSLVTDISWTHDIDADITRAHFMTHKIFDDLTQGNVNSDMAVAQEMPVSTVDFYATTNTGGKSGEGKTDGGKTEPFLTLEERYAGVNMMYGEVNQYKGNFDAHQITRKITLNNGKTWSEYMKSLDEDDKKALINAMDNVEGLSKADKDDLSARFDHDIIFEPAKTQPSMDEMTHRHAFIKYMNARVGGRTISVQCQFNPYLCAGFPGIVLAPVGDDKAGKSMRHVYGMVQVVKHTVSASGDATTAIVMSSVRFLNESSDIDDNGSPLFVPPTKPDNSRFNIDLYQYDDKTHKPVQGLPLEPLVKADKDKNDSVRAYDIGKPDASIAVTAYAKDFLMHGGGTDDRAGVSNYHYMDEAYMPHHIGKVYDAILGLPKAKHFMVGDDDNPKNKYFMYDSIEEAARVNLVGSTAMVDYEQAIRFVQRPVVTEEEYYVRVMGASFPIPDPNNVDGKVYSNDYKNIGKIMDKSKTRGVQVWYGWYDKGFGFNNDFAANQYLYWPGKGGLPSIVEREPDAPFTLERRRMVLTYLEEVNRRAFTAAGR